MVIAITMIPIISNCNREFRDTNICMRTIGIHVYCTCYVSMYTPTCIHMQRITGLCEQNTPPEKKTLGRACVRNIKSGAGEELLLLFSWAEARVKGMFFQGFLLGYFLCCHYVQKECFFHRHRYHGVPDGRKCTFNIYIYIYRERERERYSYYYMLIIL